jgi:hypothetical protein
MSGRLVAILVCVLGLLLGAVVLTKPKSSTYTNAGASNRLVNAPPSQIGRIEVREQSGEFVRVGSRSLWPGWLVEWGRGDLQDGAWPASESTRISGARILSTTMLQPGPEADLTDASEVLILSTEGEVLRSLNVGNTSLAGLLPVRAAGIDGWQAVGREIGDFLKTDALLMWRDTTALPGVDASATSIALGHNDEMKVRLRRVGSSWSLDYPVNAPAEPEAVQSLLENLIGLRSQQFTTQPVGADIFTATIELPVQGELGGRRYTMLLDTETSVCDVMLSAINSGESTEIARAGIKLDAAGSSFLIGIESTDFISKKALDLPASEIESFTVRAANTDELIFDEQRTPDGWAFDNSGFSDNWIMLFTERDADTVQIGSPDIPLFMRIEFKRFGGLDLGSYELTVDVENDIYWIGHGNVWRSYDSNIKEIDLGFGFD